MCGTDLLLVTCSLCPPAFSFTCSFDLYRLCKLMFEAWCCAKLSACEFALKRAHAVLMLHASHLDCVRDMTQAKFNCMR